MLRSSWSPAPCPCASLTALKSSRSRKHTTSGWASRRVNACRVRSRNSTRFGRPVSSSDSARSRSSSSSRRRSVTSWVLRTRASTAGSFEEVGHRGLGVAEGAVGLHEPALDPALVLAYGARERLVEQRAVAGMHPLQDRPADQPDRRQREDPRGRRALVGHHAGPVDQGEHVTGVLADRAEPGLGARQVLERRAGEGRDEAGQLDLLLAEQLAELAVGEVEAPQRLAVDGDRRDQDRPDLRQEQALAPVGTQVAGDDRGAGVDGTGQQGVADRVGTLTRHGDQVLVAHVLDADDVAPLAPQQGQRGAADDAPPGPPSSVRPRSRGRH